MACETAGVLSLDLVRDNTDFSEQPAERTGTDGDGWETSV